MLIAFLSLKSLIDAWLSVLGLSLAKMFSYAFMPLAFAMGVPYDDCGKIATLLGLKTFVNEFIAYVTLAEWIRNRDAVDVGSASALVFFALFERKFHTINMQLYTPQAAPDAISVSRRAEIIATYALCGFANLGSIGIQLGGLIPLAPHRSKDIAYVTQVITVLFFCCCCLKLLSVVRVVVVVCCLHLLAPYRSKDIAYVTQVISMLFLLLLMNSNTVISFSFHRVL
jgi:nucleoside permease NupC